MRGSTPTAAPSSTQWAAVTAARGETMTAVHVVVRGCSRLRDRARHLRKVATSTAGYGLKRILRNRPEDAALLGEALVGELDQLKGMAMKVGQILSYMDGGLPEPTQRALARLQRGQSPLPFAEVRPVLEAALGAPADELFERIDAEAIAAASIGQVHRGRHAGVEVAIKIQYPGVRETFAADVTQLRRIAGVAGLATRVDGQGIVDDLRDRLFEECDYVHEARWQQTFADWYADDPHIVVPRVHLDRSAERVLTSTWCEGRTLEAMCAAPAAERDAAAQTLARFAWSSLFTRGAIHADPHPGNQLYGADGQVIFLDFGCIREFEPAWLDSVRREIRALDRGDRAAFRDAVVAQGMVDPDRRFDWDAYYAFERHLWSPYLGSRCTFTPAWLEEGMRFKQESPTTLMRLSPPPPWIWLVRLQWGLHATRGICAGLPMDPPGGSMLRVLALTVPMLLTGCSETFIREPLVDKEVDPFVPTYAPQELPELFRTYEVELPASVEVYAEGGWSFDPSQQHVGGIVVGAEGMRQATASFTSFAGGELADLDLGPAHKGVLTTTPQRFWVDGQPVDFAAWTLDSFEWISLFGLGDFQVLDPVGARGLDAHVGTEGITLVACGDGGLALWQTDHDGRVKSTSFDATPGDRCAILAPFGEPIVLHANSAGGLLTRWRIVGGELVQPLVINEDFAADRLAAASAGDMAMMAVADGEQVALITAWGETRHVAGELAAEHLSVEVMSDGTAAVGWLGLDGKVHLHWGDVDHFVPGVAYQPEIAPQGLAVGLRDHVVSLAAFDGNSILIARQTP